MNHQTAMTWRRFDTMQHKLLLSCIIVIGMKSAARSAPLSTLPASVTMPPLLLT
jgi:hypothetical protein